MPQGEAVPLVEHIEEDHRVVDEAPARMGGGGQPGGGVLGEDQYGERLLGLADQGDHIRARPGKGNAADVQVLPGVQKGGEHAFYQRAVPAAEILSRQGRIGETRFQQEQDISLHGRFQAVGSL